MLGLTVRGNYGHIGEDTHWTAQIVRAIHPAFNNSGTMVYADDKRLGA